MDLRLWQHAAHGATAVAGMRQPAHTATTSGRHKGVLVRPARGEPNLLAMPSQC